jgi:tetratricopeptide (TPR) repeat protein
MTADGESPAAADNERGAILRRLVALLAAVTVLAAGVGGVYWYRQRASRCFARALEALADGRLDDVEQELEALEGSAAYSPQWHFLRGSLLMKREQYYPALDEFGHAVNQPELRLSTLTLSGEAAYKAGHLQDAVGLLVQATQLDPNSVTARRWLASAYYDLGLDDDAVVQLTRIAELDPRDPRSLRLLALICKDFEEYPAAVKNYRESLRRDPGPPDRDQIVFELVDCEIKLLQFDSALEALSSSAPSADRWVREADCQYGLGRMAEARRLLDQALGQEPAHLSGLLLQGTIASEQGDLATALAAFSQAVVAQPKDHVAQLKLAQAYRRSGNVEEAEKHAQAAEKIKRIREEFTEVRKKAGAEPGNADARCRLGVLAREFGRPDLARVWFRAALAIDPRHADTLRNLAGEPPPETLPPGPLDRKSAKR